MTTPLTTRPIMKAKTPRVPRSSCSYSVSWPEWPCGIISSLISGHSSSRPSYFVTRYSCSVTIRSVTRALLFMPRPQQPERLRRIDRQPRTRSEIVEEVGHPRTAHTGQDREMQPADMERRMQRRLDMPINIDHAHKEYPGSEAHQGPRFALQLARQQQRKRHRELEHGQKHSYFSPAPIHAAHEPRDLVRQVAGPNDQPLRKIEVSPHHHESKNQFAVVVHFGVGEIVGHRLALRENGLNDHAETER